MGHVDAHKESPSCLVDVPRGGRGVRGVGGRQRVAGVVRAARRRAGVGRAHAAGAPPPAGAPRADQVPRARAARGPLRARRCGRRHQGVFVNNTPAVIHVCRGTCEKLFLQTHWSRSNTNIH